MRCHKCKKNMQKKKAIPFNEYYIDGWECQCGEIYFDPEQIGRVLIINKLKKQAIRAKLGENRSNLILRLPKEVTIALDLKKGEDVLLSIQENKLNIIKA